MLDAGSASLDLSKSWRGRLPLAGTVTALHRVRGPDFDDFVRTTTVGILDAGVLDQLSAPIVTVRGSFEPLQPLITSAARSSR